MFVDWIGAGPSAALIGLFGGVLLGLAARLGRFCTLGAIEDAIYGGSWVRIRMWGVALGGAIILTFAAQALGWAEIDRSFYLSTAISPAGVILGGLLFGYGMAIAGNCGFGALARFGGGDLRSFVIVLVMGLSAGAMLSGPFAALRVDLFGGGTAAGSQGIAHQIGAALALSPTLVAMTIGFAILAAAIAGSGRIPEGRSVIWGVAVAVAISSAWVGTSWLASESFDETPVVSHSFAAPIGASMLWIMTSSGTSMTFGLGSVAGVLLGAFCGSLLRGQFRWEACDDPRELRRQIGGAICMGVGAVLAFGCSVGQGLSAFSVLAWTAPVALFSIVLGASLGLRQLLVGFKQL